MADPGPDAAVMMTLSAIAYQIDIPWQLAQKQYATAGDWVLAWGPATDDYGNLFYVARSASTGSCVVAIRGSELAFTWTSVENWFYDLDVLTQVQWPYFSDADQDAVASGAYIQTLNLTKITYSGQTLLGFLKANVTSSIPLFVTGHSLGGNIATVLAAWLSSQLGPAPGQPDANTQVYTFAAPSAGNMSFASAYNLRFPNSWRYVNSLDVVPHAWTDLLGINSIYDGFFLSTPVAVQIAITGEEGALKVSELAYDSYYDQTNGAGIILPGTPLITRDWFGEVGDQHVSNTYLGLLGAAPVTSAAPGLRFAAAEREILSMAPPVLKKGKLAGSR